MFSTSPFLDSGLSKQRLFANAPPTVWVESVQLKRQTGEGAEIGCHTTVAFPHPTHFTTRKSPHPTHPFRSIACVHARKWGSSNISLCTTKTLLLLLLLLLLLFFGLPVSFVQRDVAPPPHPGCARDKKDELAALARLPARLPDGMDLLVGREKKGRQRTDCLCEQRFYPHFLFFR